MTEGKPTRNWPTFGEIEGQLRDWQRQFSAKMQLEEVGRTAQGRSLYATQLTDAAVGDEDKEHVLITANHSGARERTATTGILYLMRWLLSDDPLAREILARQVVVCMPVCVPDSYEQATGANNVCGLSPCNSWTLDGPIDPERNPEGLAVQAMMDRYQPEVHTDYHGLDLTFPGHFAIENTGASYGNSSLRPYHYRIVQLMDEAALEEGYPSDLLEQDAERLLWGPALDEIAHKMWMGRPQVFAGTYCYNHYHSIALHSEVYWERSGFLKHRRLLQMGNEVWPGEHFPGYPARVAMLNSFNMVTAYGQTASARRRSRVELWNKQRRIVHGQLNPEKVGIEFYICATSPEASREWLGDKTLRGVVERLANHPRIASDPIRALVAQYPQGAGQWGAEPNFNLQGGGEEEGRTTPIEHGIGLRMRIPFSRAKLGEVLLNGRPLERSEIDGYLSWVARGFTYLQVNIPPEVSRSEDLFVVTCRYDPGEERTQGKW
jgi:hypothetical protein